jgi:flagellar biosynthesis protein FlhG
LEGPELQALIKQVISAAEDEFDYIIVDCRGGIDPQSIGVCSSCDAILIVAETDATSIQATQHLVDILTRSELKRKVSGFILNKVMDDPTPLAKAATSFFRSEYLGSIPFDIDATRSYIQGDLPKFSSLFSRHVQHSLSSLLASARSYRSVKILQPSEFSTVTLRSPETRLGGALLASMALYLTAGVFLFSIGLIRYDLSFIEIRYIAGFLAGAYLLLTLGSLSDYVKQTIGSIFSTYNRLFRLIIKRF